MSSGIHLDVNLIKIFMTLTPVCGAIKSYIEKDQHEFVVLKIKILQFLSFSHIEYQDWEMSTTLFPNPFQSYIHLYYSLLFPLNCEDGVYKEPRRTHKKPLPQLVLYTQLPMDKKHTLIKTFWIKILTQRTGKSLQRFFIG